MGELSITATRQLKKSKDFGLFIFVFYIIRHRPLRKVSFYFYGGKELNETGGSQLCPASPPVKTTELRARF